MKEALKLGYNIPESYVIIPPIQDDFSFVSSLEDCDWLIRPSIEESRAGLRGGICRRQQILSSVNEVLRYHGKDVQLVLQKYIHSDRAGIMLSSDEVYIECVCGAGYGLTRAGIKPAVYQIKEGNITMSVIKQEKKYQMENAKIVENPCGEYSSLSKELLDELIKMSNDFKNKVIEWCSKGGQLYFLEYWNLTGTSNQAVKGRVTYVGRSGQFDILLLPNAAISFFPDVIRSRGVIARMGGYLSHLAINCYEKRIPFVISDDDYQEGELVFLDEKEKKVIRLRNSL